MEESKKEPKNTIKINNVKREQKARPAILDDLKKQPKHLYGLHPVSCDSSNVQVVRGSLEGQQDDDGHKVEHIVHRRCREGTPELATVVSLDGWMDGCMEG